MCWAVAKQEVNPRNKILASEQFLAHIRKCVITTGTARRDAAKQLITLCEHPYIVDECQSSDYEPTLLFRSNLLYIR